MDIRVFCVCMDTCDGICRDMRVMVCAWSRVHGDTCVLGVHGATHVLGGMHGPIHVHPHGSSRVSLGMDTWPLPLLCPMAGAGGMHPDPGAGSQHSRPPRPAEEPMEAEPAL